VDASIRFFSEEVRFVLKEKRKIRSWLSIVLQEESCTPGNINIIFCGDEYLAGLNLAYLDHNTFTDILTFPLEEIKGKISGDIYISIDRIRENSKIFHQQFEEELNRVMVHGILHLVGYKDIKSKDKKGMTEKEDYYLARMKHINVSRGT